MIKFKTSKGFTLVEIMIVVAIIGLLAAIAIPNFIKARNQARKNICISNMRTLYHACEEYMIDTNTDSGTVATNALPLVGATGYVKDTPVCPSDGAEYGTLTLGTAPTCPGSQTGHVLP